MPGYSRRLPTLLLSSLNLDSVYTKEAHKDIWGTVVDLIRDGRSAEARELLYDETIPAAIVNSLITLSAATGDLDMLVWLQSMSNLAVPGIYMALSLEHWHVIDWYHKNNHYLDFKIIAASSRSGLSWCRSKGLYIGMCRTWALVTAMRFGNLDEEHLLQEGKYILEELVYLLHSIVTNNEQTLTVLRHMARNMNWTGCKSETFVLIVPPSCRPDVRQILLEAGCPSRLASLISH